MFDGIIINECYLKLLGSVDKMTTSGEDCNNSKNKKKKKCLYKYEDDNLASREKDTMNNASKEQSTIKNLNDQDFNKSLSSAVYLNYDASKTSKTTDDEDQQRLSKITSISSPPDICDINSTHEMVSNILDSVVFEWTYNTNLSSPRLLETKIMITTDTETMHNAAQDIGNLMIREITKIHEKIQKQLDDEGKLKLFNDVPKIVDLYSNDEDVIKNLKSDYENKIKHLQNEIIFHDENYKKLVDYKDKLECLVNEQKLEILDFEHCIQNLNDDCSMFVKRTNRYLENESETRRVLKAELKEKSRSEKHLTQTIKKLEKQCMFYKDELQRVINETTSSNQLIINDLKKSNKCLKIQLKEKLIKEEMLIKNIKDLEEKISKEGSSKNIQNKTNSKLECKRTSLEVERLREENAMYKDKLQTEKLHNKILNEKYVHLNAELQSVMNKLSEREKQEQINKKIAEEEIGKLQESLMVGKEDIMEKEKYNRILLENLQVLKEELKSSQESENICKSALEVTTKRLIDITSDIEIYKNKILNLEQKLKDSNPQCEIEKLTAELCKQKKLKTELEHELNKAVNYIKKLQTEINLCKNENEVKCAKYLELKHKLTLTFIDQRQLSILKNKLEEQESINNLLVQKICEIRKKSSEEFSILFQQLNYLKLHNKHIIPSPELEHVHRGIKIKLDSLKQLKYLLSDVNLISRLNYSERKRKEITRHVIHAIKMLKENKS